MSIQPMITSQKQNNQEQPADELQLLSRVLRPNLISESTQYGPGLAYNPTMLSTIPDLDLALYDENLHPQQHVLDQYNSLATGIHGFQQYNADVDIANSYLPSPCISSQSSITEDIGGAGIVSTWSVHDINSIGSTFQSQQQQQHHHHHQVTHSASGYVSGFSAASWSTPLSPMSNSSTTVCTKEEIPVSMLCSFTPTNKHSCTSTTKIVRYEWESENNRHYAAITADVDVLQDDSQNPPLLGPFLVARRHTAKAGFRLDELSIDMNDQIMVHSVVKDGWCVGERCSAPSVCGYFPVGCLLLETVPQLDNTYPNLASIWRRFSHCTPCPKRIESLSCLSCKNNTSYPDRKSLNRHLRTCIKHRALRHRRQCKTCGERFGRLDSLRRHERNQHPDLPR